MAVSARSSALDIGRTGVFAEVVGTGVDDDNHVFGEGEVAAGLAIAVKQREFLELVFAATDTFSGGLRAVLDDILIHSGEGCRVV